MLEPLLHVVDVARGFLLSFWESQEGKFFIVASLALLLFFAANVLIDRQIRRRNRGSNNYFKYVTSKIAR